MKELEFFSCDFGRRKFQNCWARADRSGASAYHISEHVPAPCQLGRHGRAAFSQKERLMRLLSVLSAAIAVVLLTSLVRADERTFGLTGENTKIDFVGTKPNGKHVGGFKKLAGSAKVDTKDLTTLKINLDIDMNSMFTDTPKLTKHLMSADFFDVKNNSNAKFNSTKIEKTGDQYTVTGKLTLAGKTKDLSFPAKIDVAGGNLHVTSNFKIDRNDWGISYGKGKIHDDVSLTVSVNAAK